MLYKITILFLFSILLFGCINANEQCKDYINETKTITTPSYTLTCINNSITYDDTCAVPVKIPEDAGKNFTYSKCNLTCNLREEWTEKNETHLVCVR